MPEIPKLSLSLDLVSISATVLGILLLLLLLQAARKGLSCLDLITDKGSNRISLTKTMNLLGGCVGAWVVMRMAIDRSLEMPLFSAYLLYCASTHGFSTWLSARFNVKAPAAEAGS